MVSIEDIPMKVRWDVATRSATDMRQGYAMAFRNILNDRMVEDVVEAIWAQGGRQVKDVADSLGLPHGNAQEVNDALGIVSGIILGPGFKIETVDSDENRVVDRVTSCPVFESSKKQNLPASGPCIACKAFNKYAVESLNPNYTQHTTKRMCMGDEYCESIIEENKGD